MNVLAGLAIGTALLCGDVNLDSNITAVDAAIVLNMAVNGTYAVEVVVIPNGVITASDALLILGGSVTNCPDIVDFIAPNPIYFMTIYADYGEGRGFIGEIENVACVFNEKFFWAIAANHVGKALYGEWLGRENFLALGALVGAADNPISGIMATCLAYPGQEIVLTDLDEGNISVRVR